MLRPHQDLKSYRQRRAQSKPNQNSPAPNTNSLQEIQLSLKTQLDRFSPVQLSFTSICAPEDIDNPGARLSTHYESCSRLQKDEVSIAKIIEKYGDVSAQIIEVNEDDFGGSKVVEGNGVGVGGLEKGKISAFSSSKNITISDKKGSNSQTTAVKPMQQQARFGGRQEVLATTTMVTPRRSKQTTPKVISSFKIERKLGEKGGGGGGGGGGRVEQGRIGRKLEMVEEEIGKAGFRREKEIRERLKEVMELMKEG